MCRRRPQPGRAAAAVPALTPHPLPVSYGRVLYLREVRANVSPSQCSPRDGSGAPQFLYCHTLVRLYRVSFVLPIQCLALHTEAVENDDDGRRFGTQQLLRLLCIYWYKVPNVNKIKPVLSRPVRIRLIGRFQRLGYITLIITLTIAKNTFNLDHAVCKRHLKITKTK